MSSKPFDITPSPRILRVLGDISLPQSRCVAELIDNAIDAFSSAERAKSPIRDKQISVLLPRTDSDDARISVRDNGPGMNSSQLENAVRAGWTSNDPFGSLGLFGMGFNIATARLGNVTEVWTSREGELDEIGIRINLFELQRSKNFSVAQLRRAKGDPSRHGTEVTVTRLKPDQRAWFAKNANYNVVKRELAHSYSPILEGGVVSPPIHLELNRARISPKKLCVWGDDRTVETPSGERVSARQVFDFHLAPRRQCVTCGLVLSPTDGASPSDCQTGGKECDIRTVERRVHGWIGVQRYLHTTEFGLDLIRNGRKIEIGNNELFNWQPEGGELLVEYPIDDPRSRGRIVGEINMDHVRVTYMKDRFEREDPAWEEMVRLVRGEGPLQPNKAKALGFGPNVSPISKIFQAFRRTSPQGKNGRWSKVLVVKNNDLALEMAKRFNDFDPEFQTDDRWWQIVESQDQESVTGGATGDTKSDLPKGILEERPSPSPSPATTAPRQPDAPPRHVLPELTREYVHPVYHARYDVEAFRVAGTDPELAAGDPWRFRIIDPATQSYGFFVDAGHEVFRSRSFSLLDALIAEISHRASDMLEGQHVSGVSFAGVLSGFRKAYCVETSLDPRDLIVRAQQSVERVATAVMSKLTAERRRQLFDELGEEERRSIRRSMLARGGAAPGVLVDSGEFLLYAPSSVLQKVFVHNAALIFDGRFWDESYKTLDFGDASVTDEARRAVVDRYSIYLAEASWLASQTPGDLERAPRSVVQRAALALELLEPDAA